MATARPYIITFAATPCSSKTPLAYYLSVNLNLPIFSTDALRGEITVDHGFLDQSLFEACRNQRLTQLIQSQRSFILDASIDREWAQYHSLVDQYHYQIFVISLDLSKDLFAKLYRHKNGDHTQAQIDQYYQDHQQFLTAFPQIPNLHLTDIDFPHRFTITLEACQDWLAQRK